MKNYMGLKEDLKVLNKFEKFIKIIMIILLLIRIYENGSGFKNFTIVLKIIKVKY